MQANYISPHTAPLTSKAPLRTSSFNYPKTAVKQTQYAANDDKSKTMPQSAAFLTTEDVAQPNQAGQKHYNAPVKERCVKAASVLLLAATSVIFAVVGLQFLSMGDTIITGLMGIIGYNFLSLRPHKIKTVLIAPLSITLLVFISSYFILKSPAAVPYSVTIFISLAIITAATNVLLTLVPGWRRRTIVVGHPEDVLQAMQNPSLRQETVGFLTADGAAVIGSNLKTLGALDNCRHLFVEQEIDRIVVVTPSFASRVLEKTESLDTNIEQHYSTIQPRLLRKATLTIDERIAKRAFDIAASGLALLLLSPALILIAIAVKFSSPGPVFFRQPRWGRNGETFHIYKFRSMYNNRCDNGKQGVPQATKNDSRITKVGGFLRKTSLDELPQLINILNGDMSLIGPRPHAVAHNFQYLLQIDGYAARHRVRPGLSGLAQVEGYRGETPTLDLMQKRVDYDNQYIDKWSLLMDIKIIFRTIKLVLKRTNAY